MQSLTRTLTFSLSGLFLAGLLVNPTLNAGTASSGTFALTGSLNTTRYDRTASEPLGTGDCD
jgi:hypothetical protein